MGFSGDNFIFNIDMYLVQFIDVGNEIKLGKN